MTVTNYGYFESNSPQNEKEARDIVRFLVDHLDWDQHQSANEIDADKVSKALDAMDKIKESFPEVFKLYDFASVKQDDGTYQLVVGDQYCWYDYRKQFGGMIQ